MTRRLLRGAARVVTCDPALPGLGVVERAAILVEHGRIAWLGAEQDLPAGLGPVEEHDANGALVTPGLVDAHAHPLFGGDRADEFAQRAAGVSYRELADAGGGIASSVAATRAASDEELCAAMGARLARARAWGTTTMEAKTGYALSVAGELRLLRLLAGATGHGVTLVPTLLGAHALPPDGESRAAYVAACAGPMIDGARGLAVAVDVYCDEGAFTLAEARQILAAARAAGLAVRAHAGQFADLGAAGLVAELGGLSADHLEQVSLADARRMADAGTVCTLLAGACVQLRLPPPPVAMLRAAGCAFALGTDLNPGSSMSESLPLQMWLATTHLGLTVEEAWLGVTRIAARAAGRPEAGVLRIGAPADLVLFAADAPAEIPYHYGANLVRSVWSDGAPGR
ncbi:MAG: imidazolonepropionase [Myxococcales bacterium]|nr:imidazolonepropionase [Myxococcales bacterium]